MPFTTGQTIVHPFHGPARVVRVKVRKVRGERIQYVDLVTVETGMAIAVPVDSIEEVGLRHLVSRERVEELLEQLRQPAEGVSTVWSRRMKDLNERAASGEVGQLAHVVREITHLGHKSPASAEGSLLRSARADLATEFAAVLKISREKAETMIDEAAGAGMALAA